jgi:GNAT superfamily N-acetyltransferase
MTITFERAIPADADALTPIQVRAFHEDARIYPGIELGGPPGYDSVEATRQKIEEEEYYKILVDGQIVGGVVIFQQAEGHFHLDVLYVDPAYHNRGIGSQAIQFIEQTYPATRWTLHTPTYAIRNHHFYEKFGYIRGEEVEEVDDGIMLYAYEKQCQI